MGYIYRYVDKIEDTIKYVGIVHANRSLKKRIAEHMKNDEWSNDSVWKVEYQEFPNMSRTDLEYLESHLISYYRTYLWYNTSKSNWGTSAIAKVDEDKWIEFDYNNLKYEEILTDKTKELYNKFKIVEDEILSIQTMQAEVWSKVLEAEKANDEKTASFYRGQFVAYSNLVDKFKTLVKIHKNT